MLRGERAAATPAFVADAEIFKAPGLFTAVLLADFGLRAILGGDIFHPLRKLLNCAAAYIAAEIRLDAEHLAQIEELMCAETVVLNRSAPVVVDHTGTVLARTDAVGPVILVGKTAAGPAEHGDMQFPEGGKHVVAVAVGVGHGRFRAYPQTTIDACAEMLGKLAVDFFCLSAAQPSRAAVSPPPFRPH